MLLYINIKNFAIISEIELDMQPEMTVVTGETGAGKSIIVDTLELALGARADTAVIKHGTDRCEITVMFDISNIEKAKQYLIAQELDSENECIIRRILTRDGRSKVTVNGNPCTQQILRSLSQFLIDIHGQHEHQALLSGERQRELLDAFADNKNLAETVKQLYLSWMQIKKESIELESLVENYPAKMDFISYQLKELENVNCDPAHLAQLRTENKRLHNLEQIITSYNAALSIVAENEAGSVITNLYQAKNQLEKCSSFEPKIANILTLFQNAIIQAEEATAELRQNLATIENDQELQEQIETELTNLYDLARKHQIAPEELGTVKINLEQQLQELANATTKLQALTAKAQQLEQDYLNVATELSNKRHKAATKLNAAITEKMQLLGMSGGQFAINFEPNINQSYSAHGLERISFLVSANPGQPLQPLTKVASGGELSRISLAIQVILAEKEVTPTLIFDEVDSGIGGITADTVGQLLRQLGKQAQVFCVTHLPQVAAKGNHHFLVTKTIKAKDTQISVKTLTNPERITEIARMLGGSNTSQQALAHAAEMLG